MRNKINTYTCSNGHVTVTIDTDEGTTPMLMNCPICDITARSAWYRCDQLLEPTHEWYKPDSLRGLSFGESDHVKQGGLLIRKIRYAVAKVECNLCSHQWIAIWPTVAEKLECPKCDQLSIVHIIETPK